MNSRGRVKELTKFDSIESLLIDDIIAKILWDCLRKNDSKGFMEIIAARCKAIITATQDKTNIKLPALYHAINYKNPTVKTLAKMVHSFEKMRKR